MGCCCSAEQIELYSNVTTGCYCYFSTDVSVPQKLKIIWYTCAAAGKFGGGKQILLSVIFVSRPVAALHPVALPHNFPTAESDQVNA